jgi:hypothetical protein
VRPPAALCERARVYHIYCRAGWLFGELEHRPPVDVRDERRDAPVWWDSRETGEAQGEGGRANLESTPDI